MKYWNCNDKRLSPATQMSLECVTYCKFVLVKFAQNEIKVLSAVFNFIKQSSEICFVEAPAEELAVHTAGTKYQQQSHNKPPILALYKDSRLPALSLISLVQRWNVIAATSHQKGKLTQLTMKQQQRSLLLHQEDSSFILGLD